TELAESVPAKISRLALRACPPLPPTVAERLSDYRAKNVADWVMYRQALARAAEALGWEVRWYDAKTVEGDAARALGTQSLAALRRQTGAELGRPWQKDHRVAMAAAIAASRRLSATR